MESSTITIPLAFIAGLASFLSPCVLPLVPGYIAQISGISIDNLKAGAGGGRARRAIVLNSLAFNAGLSLIFLMLGALAGWVGTALFTNRWVALVGGLVIVLFGLHMIGLLKIGTLYRDTRKFSNDAPTGVFGSFALGLAFAAGWTPCIGPILGGILAVAAATDGGWQNGLLLTAFYAAGLAVPFLLTGLGINQFLSFYQNFRQHLHKVEVFSGILLVLIGSMIAAGYASRLSVLAQKLPNAENAIVSLFGTSTPESGAAAASTTGSTPKRANPNARSAPDVTFTALDSAPVRLADLRGQVVLVNFWATWCGPCRAEIPVLNQMQRDYEAQGFKVIGVSWDDTAEMIRGFEQDQGEFAYQIATGGDAVGGEFGGVRAFPTSFVVDREGKIVETILGERDRAGFDRIIKPLLDEPASVAANR